MASTSTGKKNQNVNSMHMKNLRLMRNAVVGAALCLTFSAQADLTYVLQPGSTITPYYNGNPTGPAEPLTGTFVWQPYDTKSSLASFNATSLIFQSPSFLLTLDDTIIDKLLTSIFPATQTTYFGAIVDGVGISASPLEIAGPLGSYEGLTDSPVHLSYSNQYLTPYGGGYHLAIISFEAVQVPEPSTWGLLALGVVALLFTRCLRHRSS